MSSQFSIEGKVAIVTGGASGIGLQYAKEMLRNKLKAVTLADVDSSRGQVAVDEISKEFGVNKVLFVKTDVTVKSQFEEVFKKTINKFKHIDIVINNAGILNDSIWETEIAINVNGVVLGTLLALDEYLPKYKSGPEGIIVNIASILGLAAFPGLPVYTATKHAVVGLSRSFGTDYHYKRTAVKVLTLCPGVTDTPLVAGTPEKGISKVYGDLNATLMGKLSRQKPEFVAQSLIKIIKDGKNGSIWVTEGGEPTYEVSLPSREQMRVKE